MFKFLNLLNWSARKVFKPVYNRKIVVDIGAGGNPHPAADIIVEKFTDDHQRLRDICQDERLILADAESLPFKSKSIDYCFSFHVLEHVTDPSKFLSEQQRVSRAGYIETPNSIYETLHPYDVHLSKVHVIDDCLCVNFKKDGEDQFSDYDLLKNDNAWNRFFSRNPKLFHVCFNWKEEIKYKIGGVLDEAVLDKQATSTDNHGALGVVSKARPFRRVIGKIISKAKVKKNYDLLDVLCCPVCNSDFELVSGCYTCVECNRKYSSTPVPDFRVELHSA